MPGAGGGGAAADGGVRLGARAAQRQGGVVERALHHDGLRLDHVLEVGERVLPDPETAVLFDLQQPLRREVNEGLPHGRCGNAVLFGYLPHRELPTRSEPPGQDFLTERVRELLAQGGPLNHGS